MAGNSQRKGARRTSSKKGAQVGSGGKRRQALSGRGRTLPADARPWHKSYSGPDIPEGTARKQARDRRQAEARADQGRGGSTAGRGRGGTAGTQGRGGPVGGRGRGGTGAKPTGRPPAGRGAGATRRGPAGRGDTPELLVGRNPVVEALRAHVPATTLYVAQNVELDDRIAESVRIAGNRGIPILEVSRSELTRMLGVAGDVVHQGIGLAVPPFNYEPFEDVLADAGEAVGVPPLLVGLDGVTDPRNLGAVVRSAAAFGAHGVFMPERRSAGMTATAWRASAGAATRLPIAKATNLPRALKACQEAGFVVVGLDADGEVSLYDLEVAVDPLVVVVGSEGRGLSRLVGETCDMRVRIPMVSDVESLNASVAAAVTLAEVARRRSLG